MIRSDEIGELAKALCAAQGEFEAIDKSASNPFFKSAYAPLPEVVKAASPILTKHGLSVSQCIGSDDKGDTLTTWLLHASGQFIAEPMQLRPVKSDPQAQGSAVTYARRYSYMAVLGLVADEDDDGNQASGNLGAGRSKPTSRQRSRTQGNGRPTAAKPASAPQDASSDPDASTPASDDALKELKRQYQSAGTTKDQYAAILKEVGAESTAALTEDQATWVILKLRGLVDA